jgi:ABC-type branched-subunit amino acid transport system ATPase component
VKVSLLKQDLRIHTTYSVDDSAVVLDLTIFLVEHDMSVVMSICERIQVLDQGRVPALGELGANGAGKTTLRKASRVPPASEVNVSGLV